MIKSTLNELYKEIKKSNEINTSAWGEFKLISLFPDYSHGSRLTKSNRVDGDMPLITAGQFNNGISNYIKPPANMTIYKNCLTIDMFGNVFYQDGEFVCDDNVYPFKNIPSKNAGLFLAAVIKKALEFDFKKQFRLKHFPKIYIKLPSIKENDTLVPDWKYMSDYIDQIHKYVIEGFEFK